MHTVKLAVKAKIANSRKDRKHWIEKINKAAVVFSQCLQYKLNDSEQINEFKAQP